MKKIVCYRRGCNQPARYELPGRNGNSLHICRQCLLDLYPKSAVVYREPEYRPVVGPTEFKLEQPSEAEERAEAERLLAEAGRLER